MKQIILLADNNNEFREVWGKVLTNAGYEVKLAASPQETRLTLLSGGIELAILDVRLVDDDDPKDISGLSIATENAFYHVPKIMLTGFNPSPENIHKLQQLSTDKLPFAITWIGKDENSIKVLEIIPKAISHWHYLQQMQTLISERLVSSQGNNLDHQYLAELSQMIAQYFNKAELKVLCFILDVDYSDLAGKSRMNKAMELVLYLERRGYLTYLEDEVAKQRPNASWPSRPKYVTECL